MPENVHAVRDNGADSRAGGSSAVDAAAERILDLIRARQLNVGDVLPTERELSEITGASRNTVREALRTIRTYGLIEPKPRVGAVLADGQSIAIQNFFAAHMDVSRSSFADIQGFRRIIEVGIGDHIVFSATNAEIDALDEINARIVESRSIEEAAKNDFNFHMALIGLADNRMLTDMYSFLSPVILRIMAIGKEMRPVLDDTRAAHGEIIAALRARDRLAYAYLVSRHLDFALRFLPEEPASDT
ncbi:MULTISPECIES: FCD domain-containing protein [unclassified Mesorhizobium]|uniref:FadR/GntR family transcriptional regulator n=1 Tax=unclassified Mesorhizobium TaxID=325217 RepID=UPI000FCAF703|nr:MULTISPECIES: FCD domain-containing protein [unclassified Mesorhizobium]TGP18899.1 FadR family transcriptional regulator [Mesorhizobium sp. M1D.F.Ca.ET.231.01.1.1]TGP25609.1 FadR family transcriptional regulator [Mesorhizobium sp. M1D.F.Ca.ET.234.01.1.1]TGS39170.1 FadR family transcriptional regulator [Mesorhizobium sp. M1D.F.Ca.ET.184.01.1.1]TGS58580.1 FadR family transcriptional regulator [Mesorhizobium sp. M1D.F.Ca.ET.183.01.1.1]